jgi:hypothetical protein
MTKRQKWIACAALAAYAAFILVFRETAESALSAIFHFIGAAL